jgi:hypothetical protein
MCLFSGGGGIDLEYTYVEFYTNTKKQKRNRIWNFKAYKPSSDGTGHNDIVAK